MNPRIESLEKMLGGPRDGALLRFSLGNEYLKAGDAATAGKCFREAVDRDRQYSAAWKALGKALADDGADVRHAAAWAIADLPETVAPLAREIVAAADDDDVRVRMEVAGVLGRLGTPEAEKALRALAADEDDNVADVAKGVIGGKAAAR